MKVMIEFLLQHHESGEFDISRVPCIEECLTIGSDEGKCYRVVDVIHYLDPKPVTVKAIVRVK